MEEDQGRKYFQCWLEFYWRAIHQAREELLCFVIDTAEFFNINAFNTNQSDLLSTLLLFQPSLRPCQQCGHMLMNRNEEPHVKKRMGKHGEKVDLILRVDLVISCREETFRSEHSVFRKSSA